MRLDREGDRDMVIVHPSEMYIRSMHHGSISNIGHLDHRPRSRDYLRDRAAPVPDPSLRSRALLLALDRLQETEPELSTVGAQRRVESMNGTENLAESSIASARASSVVVFDTRPGTNPAQPWA